MSKDYGLYNLELARKKPQSIRQYLTNNFVVEFRQLEMKIQHLEIYNVFHLIKCSKLKFILNLKSSNY